MKKPTSLESSVNRETSISKRRAKLSPAKRAFLEKRLQGQSSTKLATSRVIPCRPDEAVYPLSFAQERFWFLDQLEPGNPVYNRLMAVRLTGSLDVVVLERVLNEILRRHEVLRANYSNVDGQPVQRVVPVMTLGLPMIDLVKLPESERLDEAARLAREEAQRAFDLNQGHLLRSTLLHTDDEEHILLLVMHHICFDGWSAKVFVREMAELYEAFSASKPSPLPGLPIQYADFAHWQRQWLQGEVLETQLAYWKKALVGISPILDLPTDRPRPAQQTNRGACHRLLLPVSLLESLKAFGRQEGVTLFMALLAAFQVLLYRYTGQEDIVVGSPIAGRTRADTEGLVGFFTNTLLLRTDLSGDPTFRELLERVREVALGAYAHQDLPFEKLVQELHPDRNLSHTPLFQVMFNLENIPLKDTMMHDLRIEEIEFDSGTVPFDLTVEIVHGPDGWWCLFKYNADLFHSTTIARMSDHYGNLLQGIVGKCDQRLSELSFLTQAERLQLLDEWNHTKSSCPEDMCVHQLIELQAQQTPDSVAVVFRDRCLTYRDLTRQANQLARYLLRLGVGPDVLVGICMERSLEMVIGLLGILKAGAAYVPLDPAYPAERLAFMLEDTQMSVLLTQQHLSTVLPNHKAHLVFLDADWPVISQQMETDPKSDVATDSLAYVIYTSGSTGKPKGVMIEHRSLVNYTRVAIDEFAIRSVDRVLQFASITFDAAAEEIFPTLVKGATLVLRTDEMLDSVSKFLRTCREWRLTVLDLPTAYWHELVIGLEESRASWPPSLRLVIIGGEKVLLERLILWQKLIGQRVRLLNTYGPTETTIVATMYDFSDLIEAYDTLHEVPIGRPIRNAQVYVLDSHLNTVPVGILGELCIGGVGLARGYLNRPDLTDERFTPDPFTDEQNARLYRTGDKVRFLPDGNLQFFGRFDDQVKIRGFRIELGEIEATLRQHPGVHEAIVLVKVANQDEARLVAYAVPARESVLTIQDLQHYTREKLPDYMVPSVFVLLDSLPLTQSGKVDRGSLPEPEHAGQGQEESFVAPKNQLELRLVRIWSQILDTPLVGTRDSFFDLGGHSLSAVRLLARINKTFDCDLPLAALFQAPTIEQLANTLQQVQQSQTVSWNSLVPMQVDGSKPPLFFVPGNMGNVHVDLGALCRHLGQDQPFYGLQDGIQNPVRIKALAKHYLDEIHTVQPEGPYFLGGVCSGGAVAFEMAQQLQAQGQLVPWLALIEPSRPEVPTVRAYAAVLISAIRRLLGGSDRLLGDVVVASDEARRYLRLRLKLVANQFAIIRYHPRPYSGQIDLYLTQESLQPSSSRLGWCELTTGSVRVCEIPGEHDTITGNRTSVEEAHMRVVAEQIRVSIDEILSRTNL
jgi:amino acid adenylation domain-containing protein